MLLPVLHQVTSVATGSATTQIDSPWTTGWVTPASGNVNCSIVHGFAQKGSPFTDTATVSGGGLTWTKIYSALSGNFYHFVFIGKGTVTATAVNITFNATPTGGRLDSWNFPMYGSVAATPNVQGAEGTGTTGTVTWTNPGIGYQHVFGMWVHQASESTTPDSTTVTWTEVSESNAATGSFERQWLVSAGGKDFTHTATWATSSFWSGVVLSWPVQVLDASQPNETYLTPLSGGTHKATNPLPSDSADSDAWAILA